MPSQLKLHRTFADCESENLQKIERLQGWFEVLIAGADGQLKALSSNLTKEKAQELLAEVDFSTLPSSAIPTLVSLPSKDLLVHVTAQGDWCFESDPSLNRLDSVQLTLPSPMPNLARFAQQLCDRVFDQLPYNRVLVYQFHADESGEVIAEKIAPDLEPFIGLNYPATDIPRQARRLYAQLPARMVFSNVESGNHLTSFTDDLLDITQVVSRGVSPYHLQYLQNMGSASTASVGIEVGGKLWGLLSMHSDTPIQPSLGLYCKFAELKPYLSQSFGACHLLAEEAIVRRNQTLIQRYSQHINNEFDLAYSLLLGPFALYRLVGGVGAAVITGDKLAQVGETPSSELTRSLFRWLLKEKQPIVYCHNIQERVEFHDSGLGGYAFVRLSEAPWTGLLIFRRQVVQTVSWGGDPRNAVVAGDSESVSYTPRASFERWTELVQGQCIPWEARTTKLLDDLLAQCKKRFESNAGALGSLFDYSLQQIVYSRTRILQRLNEQFEQLRQGIAIAIQTGAKTDRSILSINHAATIAFNMSSQEAEGMQIDDFAESTNIPISSLENGSITHVSVWTNDAGHRDLEVEVQQQFDFQSLNPDECLTVQIFYLTDITQSKRVEMALHAAYRKSERLASAQHEMFAKLMHEMRTPLNSIIGFSSFLSDPKLVPAERDDFIRRIVRNAESLSFLLKHSNDHMKVLQTEVQQSNDVCAVIEAIQEVIEDLSLMAAETAIEIEFIPTQDQPTAAVPKAAMRQILTNLINNSLKYSAAGQVVTVGVAIEGAMARITVTDQGIGMSSQQVLQACEPFVRFTETQGSGLGLSIVKQLLLASGGDIHIHSELGIGTVIDVSVPLDSRVHVAKAVPPVLDLLD